MGDVVNREMLSNCQHLPREMLAIRQHLPIDNISHNIYMFICSELIEETGRPPGLIFGMWGYFGPGSDKFESWKKIHTFDGIMT